MELFDYIEKSPNAYFAVDTMAQELKKAGYERLNEKNSWKLKAGKYFVTRDDSSLIAFCIPKKNFKGFHIIASHSDSPAFKVKPNPEMKVGDAYVKLNVEKQGDGITAVIRLQ